MTTTFNTAAPVDVNDPDYILSAYDDTGSADDIGRTVQAFHLALQQLAGEVA